MPPPETCECVGFGPHGLIDSEEDRLLFGAKDIEFASDDDFEGRVVYADSGC